MFNRFFVLLFILIFIKPTSLFECGVRKVKSTISFINGGQMAQPGQWPWLVSLFKFNPFTRRLEYFCGSTLINDKTLVTGEFSLIIKVLLISFIRFNFQLLIAFKKPSVCKFLHISVGINLMIMQKRIQ